MISDTICEPLLMLTEALPESFSRRGTRDARLFREAREPREVEYGCRDIKLDAFKVDR